MGAEQTVSIAQIRHYRMQCLIMVNKVCHSSSNFITFIESKIVEGKCMVKSKGCEYF